MHEVTVGKVKLQYLDPVHKFNFYDYIREAPQIEAVL
jgi:hypothetical protein